MLIIFPLHGTSITRRIYLLTVMHSWRTRHQNSGTLWGRDEWF